MEAVETDLAHSKNIPDGSIMKCTYVIIFHFCGVRTELLKTGWRVIPYDVRASQL